MSIRRIEIATRQPYTVHVGVGALGEAADEIETDRRVAILSDRNVAPLHLERLGVLARAPLLAVTPGEDSKSFASLEQVINFLVEADLDRSSVLIALGGGVVSDLGGLAASLFMRGIGCVHCPTTLVAQVDAAIGGKTGVNLRAGKNLAGTFHQPQAVLVDPETLSTLPRDEFRSGLGEVIKTAVIGDEDLFRLLEEGREEVLMRDLDLTTEIIERCVRVKGKIVAADEEESGERKRLNLGHTFAHAIERAAGFGVIPHGEAVAVGLALAVETSARVGVLEDPALLVRVSDLLVRLKLCSSLAALRDRYGAALAAQDVLSGMRHDKKGTADRPLLVLCERIGATVVDQPVDPAALSSVLG